MGMIYTEAGLAAISQAISEEKKVSFSKVELSADEERSPQELLYTAEIVHQEIRDDTCICIKAVADNYGFEEDYYFNRINIYIADESGENILFCYQQYDNCPFYIPVYDGKLIQSELSIYVKVASSEVIDITAGGAYVLYSEFENRMNTKIGFDDIVQNAATRDPQKIASAAVVADLQDQITEQNTNMLVTGSFTGVWTVGFNVAGFGFIIIIPKNHKVRQIKVTKIKTFSGQTWVDLELRGIGTDVNCWTIVCNFTSSADTFTYGMAYLVAIDGEIS